MRGPNEMAFSFGPLVIPLVVVAAAAMCIYVIQYMYSKRRISTSSLSINYHFTRQCNYKCKFCFHTAKTSYVLPLDEAKKGIRMLVEYGMKKINFSGGEPFLEPKMLGEMVVFSKQLGISTSVVSNGSKIREKWLINYGKHLDILAISCDSGNPDTLTEIGRGTKGVDHIAQLRRIRDWCGKYGIVFKLNTTVVKANVHEDMNDFVRDLKPSRWKVFQCLLITGENACDDDIRDARTMVISDEEFTQFAKRHSDIKEMVTESNESMRNSYLILDERMRFLDNQGGSKKPSNSVLDVGVEAAINHSGFDEKMFLRRGGVYKWSKENYKDLSW